MRKHNCEDYERMTVETLGKEGYYWLLGRNELMRELYRVDAPDMYYRKSLMHMIRDEPKTYRVSITKHGIDVVCFDLENIDSELEGHYDSPSDLPMWVQEKVAVLAVCSPEPPTPTVEGVGRRISANVYWVYK